MTTPRPRITSRCLGDRAGSSLKRATSIGSAAPLAPTNLALLVPIFLVGISIAAMVGAGHLNWAIVVTGAAILIIALVTMFTVKEQPLTVRSTDSFWPPILRVFAMLGGILVGVLLGMSVLIFGMGVDYSTNIYLSPAMTDYLNARLSPGVAYQLTDSFSIGLALNVMMAQMKYDVAGNVGQVKHSTATSWGYGATLGVKFSPIPLLSLGAAYETRSHFQDCADQEVSGDAKSLRRGRFDGQTGEVEREFCRLQPFGVPDSAGFDRRV